MHDEREARVRLDSLGCELSLAAMYEQIEFA
jgi:hypothetical protein